MLRIVTKAMFSLISADVCTKIQNRRFRVIEYSDATGGAVGRQCSAFNNRSGVGLKMLVNSRHTVAILRPRQQLD
jgi:hypothetical protein